MTAPTVGFAGTGAIALTLARALARAGHPVRLAHARPGAPAAPWTHDLPLLDSPQELADACDLVMLAVPDDRIAEVCGRLRWRRGASVVHLSGATEVSALDAAAAAGAETGGFHPLQMFANVDAALAGLAGCAVAIEAAEPLRATLHALATAVGLRPFDLPPGVRARYHASATYVGPFVITVLREAAALWESWGATEADAMAALGPLLSGTLDAVKARGLAGGMGGCFARGDTGTVGRHLAALDALDPRVGALYRELARRAVPIAVRRGSLTAEGARAMDEVINPDQSGV